MKQGTANLAEDYCFIHKALRPVSKARRQIAAVPPSNSRPAHVKVCRINLVFLYYEEHYILTSSFPPAYPVIYDRRNGHRWFFAIIFCHPPSFFLSTLSSGFLFFFIQTVSCLLSACRDVKTIIFYTAVHVYLLHKNIWIFLDTPNNRD